MPPPSYPDPEDIHNMETMATWHPAADRASSLPPNTGNGYHRNRKTNPCINLANHFLTQFIHHDLYAFYCSVENEKQKSVNFSYCNKVLIVNLLSLKINAFNVLI